MNHLNEFEYSAENLLQRYVASFNKGRGLPAKQKMQTFPKAVFNLAGKAVGHHTYQCSTFHKQTCPTETFSSDCIIS